MVTTAIHFKSPGTYIFISTCPGSTLRINLYRQPDGLLRIVVLIASVNLLGAVFPCKSFPIYYHNSFSAFFIVIHRICWPFGSDQPIAAAHLTETLNVAFEFFQVRTGQGLKPLHRNGLAPTGTREAVGIEARQIIDLCRSEKGQELRSNAKKLKVMFAKAWEDDGAARKEIRNLLHKYT